MAESTEKRITITLDAEAERDLAECMAAVALARDGENITITRTVRASLRRWADALRRRA